MVFRHVDVFADRAYSGNGLIVFFGGTERPAEELQAITTEMRQFESIFVSGEPDGHTVAARVFTVEEELCFAGHPIIGAAAAAHERWAGDPGGAAWTFLVGGREIQVRTRPKGAYYEARMNQGRPTLGETLDESAGAEFAEMLGLRSGERSESPLQVVSTGLPYLIVPVTSAGLERARIRSDDFGSRLDSVGAKFVYVLDPDAREGRTWDNAGDVEDVATGSAAGPAAAYLLHHGLASESSISLEQGRFAGRPSVMSVEVGPDSEIWVGGPVSAVASGTLDAPPQRI